MARKSFSEYQSFIINKLCLRWETIRRNPAYISDYKIYHSLENKLRKERVPQSLDDLKDKYKNRNLLEDKKSHYHDKWELDHLLEPNFSFATKLNNAKSLKTKLKLASKLKRLFRFKRAVDWPIQIFKIDIDDILDSSMDISDFDIDHEKIRESQNIGLTINISSPADQLINEFREIVKTIKDFRIKHGIEIPPHRNRRPVLKLNDFETFDSVMQKDVQELTWKDWEFIAKKRYPQRVGDMSNKIKLVKNEFKRVQKAIADISPKE